MRPIAIVIGETVTAAADGAAAVWADYEPLGAIVDAEAAFDDDAPVIFPDHGSNQALVVTDAAAVDLEAISDVVVRGRYVNQRVAVVPMETNGCAAIPGDDGRLTFYASTQMPHGLHAAAGRCARHGARRHPHHLPAGRRRLRRQGRHLRRSTPPSPPAPATSTVR